ncbi:MAG: GUN4 domain-containing protein [Rivularia sp. (in: cyanobacteria)]
MGEDYSVIVFKLIEWAEAQGKIEELLNAACKVNPGNQLLRDFQEQMQKPKSQALIIQSQTELQKINYQQPYNYETEIALKNEENFISPNKEIDYKRLKDFLKAEKFQEADEETKNILLFSLEKNIDEGLGVEEIRSLSPEILSTIDELWMRYSNQKFGFSKQRSIWENVLSPQKEFRNIFLQFRKNKLNNSDKDNWYKFTTDIGWYHINIRTGRKEWIQYTNLDFSLDAPEGYFPYFRSWWKGMRYQHEPERCIALMEQIDKFIK